MGGPIDDSESPDIWRVTQQLTR